MTGKIRYVAPLALIAVVACDDPAPLPARAPSAALVPWAGNYVTLFDDAIDPAALGYSLDGKNPAVDPLLKHRTKAAELVARMKLLTVSRDANGTRPRYLLNLRVGLPPLARARLQEVDLELAIAQGTSAFELLSSNESGLRGRIFIGFVRRFAGVDGPVLRWHLTADSPEVAQAVQTAAALDDLGYH